MFSKGIWLFHAQTCYAEQDYSLMMTDGHIVLKGIWLLHAQLFYAEQDFPLNFPDDHIVRKGIWVLHEQPFCAELDFPYLIADDELLLKIIKWNWSHEYTIVLIKWPLSRTINLPGDLKQSSSYLSLTILSQIQALLCVQNVLRW